MNKMFIKAKTLYTGYVHIAYTLYNETGGYACVAVLFPPSKGDRKKTYYYRHVYFTTSGRQLLLLLLLLLLFTLGRYVPEGV